MRQSLILLAAAAAVCAQPPIVKPAQPRQFLEAAGPHSALLGNELGTFEGWVFPIKVISGFELAAFIDGGIEPAPLSQFAERVEASPDRSTIVHTHAAFTIRQTWVAAIQNRAAFILLDVQTSKPLRLRATFLPEMKPMWPASFGGQSTSWDGSSGVLAFTEGLRRYRPVLGSPAWAKPSTRISEQIGHQLPDRRVLIEFDVSLDDAKRGPVVIGMAWSREEYDKAMAALPSILQRTGDYYSGFLWRTTTVEAGDLSAPFLQAKLAMEKGWACNTEVGCGLIAGWAPSGASERPGFGWYFGGDALMNVWAILDYGDFPRAKATLEFLMRLQRADGRIPHEVPQSYAMLDWSKYPYGYYHADTTPLLLYSLWQYARRSGDREFVKEHWAQVEKAYQQCLTYLDDDGLLSNRRGGAAAVETGALSGKVEKDIYLQGVWLAGLQGYAAMAAWVNEPARAAEANQRLAKARAALDPWYLPDRGHYAFAKLRDGSWFPANSGWQAFAVAHGGLPAAPAAAAAKALGRPQLFTPWGTRLFATDSPNYDPLGYNDGSVWPFVTAFAAMAEYGQGLGEAGYRRLWGMAQATGLGGAGFISENFSGDRFAPLPHAVPHQLFSSMAMVHPLVSGMLGLDGDAVAGTLRVAPQVPCSAGTIRFANYRVGTSVISGTIEPNAEANRIQLKVEGTPLKISEVPGKCFPMEVPRPLTPGQQP